MSELLGYARVSTTDQDAALQLDALNAAGCYRVWVDTISGSLEHRPELTKLLDQLRPGDTLVVWRLDRLGRSIRHLIDQLQALGERGVVFRSLQETIDTTSPGGRLVFHVFAALTESNVISSVSAPTRARGCARSWAHRWAPAAIVGGPGADRSSVV
ncbi:recombinase family protein [Curtobacterium flaccumfaciens]|uniref:recombinase family protein n=1 Tax=Curtobacterium flaccumfaciens TaxID=2035 RepID=UPI003D9A94DD